MARVTFHHLIGWLETGVCDLSYCQLLVVSLLSRNDRGVGGQREVDTGIWHQVGLELGQVNIEGTIKTKGSSDGGHNLTDQPVKISVSGALDIEVPTADIVDGLVIDHEGTVG